MRKLGANSIVFSVLAMILPIFLQQSVSQPLGMRVSTTLDATFGLDSKTREFIQGMPREVRDQVLGLLKDALPLIDSSVLSYIEAVDDIMGRQLNNLQCSAVGAGLILGADLRSRIPLVGGTPPQPVEDTRNDRDRVVSSFLRSDAPARYRERYADLLYRVATAACQVSISADAKVPITEIQRDIRGRFRVWDRKIGICTDASSCVAGAQIETRQLIDRSDRRDNEAVSASQRLNAVVLPRLTSTYSPWDPYPYEKVLIDLFSISDGIEIARRKREEIANALAKSASVELGAVKEQIRRGRSGFNRRDDNSNAAAIRIADHADLSINVVRGTIQRLREHVSVNSNLIGPLEAEVQAQANSAEAFRQEARNAINENRELFLKSMRDLPSFPK